MRSRVGLFLGRTRLGSGLVLFAYVSTHLANHALGLVSLDAMETGRAWFLTFWRNPVGTCVLYGALATHLGLALWSVYRRRTLRMPRWEAVQLLLGIAIPPFLTAHIIGTRLASAWFDQGDSYRRVVLGLWVLAPQAGLRQALVLVIAWLHGCVGLHFWLRLRPWYPRVSPLLFAGVLLVPVLALLGFAHAGREVARLAREPGWVQRTLADARAVSPEARDALKRVEGRLLTGLGAALGLTLVARALRRGVVRRFGGVRIEYPGGQKVTVPLGASVLEASRSAGIPHASVCGGRGRCSTCRIRVTRGLDALPPADAAERRVLRRIGAPPNVRLACQLRPSHDASVFPLLPPTVQANEGHVRVGHAAGSEREVAVLFADLRGFTTIAEHRLPYDVVFFLNRYFEAVGAAIERAGGVANQFTGDGVMALFGVETSAEDGCRCALAAAHEIVRDLGGLSQTLAEELPAPLRVGIGIHVGPAVVGRMGYKDTVYLTAVGDTVHVASRFQELTKQYGCQLVISEEVVRRAGVDASLLPRHDLTVRNRQTPLTLYVVHDVEALAPTVTAPA